MNLQQLSWCLVLFRACVTGCSKCMMTDEMNDIQLLEW